MSTQPRPLAVIDSGGANIASVLFALKRIGVETELTADPEVIQSAERVLLPGVGSAQAAMSCLRKHGLVPLIRSLTQPVLGICVGMQLLFESSTESDSGETDCLGVLPGQVQRLRATPGIRVPHMGWNALTRLKSTSPLLKRIQDGDHCYFVHSYAVSPSEHTLAESMHGEAFSAVVQRENFHGAQFHPERSGPVGLQLLKNFMSMTQDMTDASGDPKA